MIDADTKYRLILSYIRDRKSIAVITHEYGISRSTFYKWLNKFLQAGKQALQNNRPDGRRTSKITDEITGKIVITTYHKPGGSSYEVAENLAKQDIKINPKTIQRIWKSYGLIVDKTKTTPEKRQVRNFTQQEKEISVNYMKDHINLGSYRLGWDIMNLHGIKCSPMTIRRWREVIRPIQHKEKPIWRFYERKHPHSLWHGDFLVIETNRGGYYFYQFALLDDYSRAYVGCGIFETICFEAPIKVIIAAVRKWKAIPKMLLLDNEGSFHSKLVKTFCDNLGIRLIHCKPYHPQTNGKLERAHWDDTREFYNLHPGANLDQLCVKLPEYLHYRNYIRGHWALKGKPAITRLSEYQPEEKISEYVKAPNGKHILLDDLEKYAEVIIGTRTVNSKGAVGWQNQLFKLGCKYKGQKAQIVSTADGIKIYANGRAYWWLLALTNVDFQKGYEFRYKNLLPIRLSQKEQSIKLHPPILHVAT